MGGFCGVVRRIEFFKCPFVLSLAKGQALLPSVRPEVSKGFGGQIPISLRAKRSTRRAS